MCRLTLVWPKIAESLHYAGDQLSPYYQGSRNELKGTANPVGELAERSSSTPSIVLPALYGL